MSEIKTFLKRIEMFIGLSDKMLDEVTELATIETYQANSTIIERNSPPLSFYIIQEGTVEIITGPEEQIRNRRGGGVVVTLGKGQSFGEMGLVDNGARSATVKAGTNTKLLSINCKKFVDLCETDTGLGYNVMRNIAIDLSFKLRYRNLI